MSSLLRVLLVEDSEDDAGLLLRELRKGGFAPECRRVDNGHDFESALRTSSWDIVITDHNLPGYSSEATLASVKHSGLDIPVIIVSGSIGEEIAVAAMKNGAHDYIMKSNLSRLVPAVERELRETQNRHAHRLAQQTIQHLALHDPLTGLTNRHEFEVRLGKALEEVGNGVQHALLYMDLDQFKVINDTCGHDAGDELLRQLSIVLREPIRDIDTLARLGGDEFGVLLLHCSLGHAKEAAERLLKAIKDFRYVWRDKTFSIGASIGLVMLSERNQTTSDVMRISDMACYAAKDKGRNRIHVYHADDAELLQRHGEMEWVARINKALEENHFVLYRQCIDPLGHNGTRHCEFLIRMNNEDKEPILPGAFIPAAERYDLMPKLDRWVIRNAFEFLAKQKTHCGESRSNSHFINLSGATLSDDNFASYVIEQLEAFGLPPEIVGFEITETAVISNLSSAINFIEQVKELGCKIALDDFGAGLSSFSYLKTIPADYLKIDGSFVRDILDDPMDHAIVDAINKIGHVAGLKTIAEYVESDQIKQRLAELGIDYAQGFAIEHPSPLPTLPA